MLIFYTGSDTAKAREKLNAALEKEAKRAEIVRITDAHRIHDLAAALAGGGMFGGARVVLLDHVLGHEEMRALVLERLESLRRGSETVYLYESAPDATTKKLLEKHAEKAEKFDAAKKAAKDDFFAIPNAMQRGAKKDLWLLLQREFAAGKAPEMVHGTLFWAAKQMVLKARTDKDRARGKTLVAKLAELPHEARRNGFELEYALEHFVLSGV